MNRIAAPIDLASPVLSLCLAGTQAQYEGRAEAACAFFWQAWLAVTDDFEACVAAHYVAGCQATPEAALEWHLEALDRAGRAAPEQVKSFYPSLYVNLGQAYEALGHTHEAQRFYALAADLGLMHEADPDVAHALSTARPTHCRCEPTE